MLIVTCLRGFYWRTNRTVGGLTNHLSWFHLSFYMQLNTGLHLKAPVQSMPWKLIEYPHTPRANPTKIESRVWLTIPDSDFLPLVREYYFRTGVTWYVVQHFVRTLYSKKFRNLGWLVKLPSETQATIPQVLQLTFLALEARIKAAPSPVSPA